ncbi:MAG TPA: hypothetical protein VFS00_24680 [Polyangiaceae bacterium]|nr:hypothetical protein [Polyangiaceae bacterium]
MALALGGCKAGGEAPPTGGSTGPAPSAPTPVASAQMAKPAPLVDLLHETAAEVAVSSNVRNPHDFPEHLVDGRPETAWNGKTGDLVGGWVAFRLPSGVRVRRIELSAGFDKTSPAGDLFTMNHRVRRVRVSHDGKTLFERDLDPAIRAPQPLDLERPRGGGVYRIEILAVEPGTKAAWRELSLSELKVWGEPGPARLERPTVPPVGVGDFPQPKPPPSPPPAALTGLYGRAYPSLAAFCRAFGAAVRPPLDAKFDGSRYPGRIEGPDCQATGPLVPRFTPDGWAEAVYGYAANDLDGSFHSFAVKTPAGIVPAHVVFSSHEHGDPGCSGGNYAEVRQARFDGGRLHLTLIKGVEERLRTQTLPDGTFEMLPPRAELTKVDVSCALEGGTLSCIETELASACVEGSDNRGLPPAPTEPDWTQRCPPTP